MAEIIPFPKVKSTAGEVRDEPCQILIFSGVRIERHEPFIEQRTASARSDQSVGPRDHRTGT